MSRLDTVVAASPALGPGDRRRRPRGRWALLLLLAIGIGAPLVSVLVTAVTGYNGKPQALTGLAHGASLHVIGNTVLLGVLVVAIATLMAAPLAFLMSWTRMRRHRWLDIVLMIPFMTPPYAASLGWLDFTRIGGLGDQWFGTGVGGVLRGFILSPLGMATIMACEIFTFLYLILRNHLDSIPAALDETAAISGASPWQRLRRVLAPLSTANFALGALIVFIRAIGEFGAPITIGYQIHFPVLVSEIYQDVTIAPLDFPTAAAFSSVLLALGVVVWGVQQRVARRTIVFGARVARRTTVHIGAWAGAGWAWLSAVIVFAVVIPYISIVLGAMTVLRSAPLTASNMTFDYFRIVLQSDQGLPALRNSIELSLLAASIATVLGVVTALVTATRPRGTARLIDALAITPDAVPAIVSAIGLIFVWNAPWLPATPYNTRGMIVLAYTFLFLPLVVQNVKTARRAVDDRLLEAAVVSGGRGIQNLMRILLPLLAPGIFSGWLLSFLLGTREVVLSSMLRPPTVDLLSPWIIGQFDQGHRAEAMAMTVIGVLGSTVVLLIVEVWRRRLAGRRLA